MEFLPWNEVANERNTLGPSEQKNLPDAKRRAAIHAAFFIRLSAEKRLADLRSKRFCRSLIARVGQTLSRIDVPNGSRFLRFHASVIAGLCSSAELFTDEKTGALVF
jgi:hypothetical protein